MGSRSSPAQEQEPWDTSAQEQQELRVNTCPRKDRMGSEETPGNNGQNLTQAVPKLQISQAGAHVGLHPHMLALLTLGPCFLAN